MLGSRSFFGLLRAFEIHPISFLSLIALQRVDISRNLKLSSGFSQKKTRHRIRCLQFAIKKLFPVQLPHVIADRSRWFSHLSGRRTALTTSQDLDPGGVPLEGHVGIVARLHQNAVIHSDNIKSYILYTSSCS